MTRPLSLIAAVSAIMLTALALALVMPERLEAQREAEEYWFYCKALREC